MKIKFKPKKLLIPVMALAVGLGAGWGTGQVHLKKERQVFQEKIRDAGKKMAFIQKKMADEKNEATVTVEQKCRTDMDRQQKELKALGAQAGRMKEQMRQLEVNLKEAKEAKDAADKSLAGIRKERHDLEQKHAQSIQKGRDLERDVKKLSGEQESLQAELKKAHSQLARCGEHNAKLCLIAEDLVKAYRNKGIGAAILEQEPLTQIRKVDLERLVQTYREDIELQKMKKK